MGVTMRGDDGICGSLFSYIDLEKRVRADHPLRVIRQIVNAALKSLSGEFARLYSPIGRESIPPERLMRALLLQAFYSIRSERQLVEPHADRPQPVTLGADKGYDVGDFVMELREKAVTPHVAQSTNGRRSAIDGRTTRHSGHAVSQRIRKRVEEAFGWAKTVAGLRKMRHRGLPKVGWQFTLAMAAYDLARLPRLLAQPVV